MTLIYAMLLTGAILSSTTAIVLLGSEAQMAIMDKYSEAHGWVFFLATWFVIGSGAFWLLVNAFT